MLALWKWNMTKNIADGYASDTVTYDEMRVENETTWKLDFQVRA